MLGESPLVFCKEHREQITHLNITLDLQNKISLCDLCPKTSNSLSLSQAFQKGEALIQEYQQILFVKKNLSSSIHKISKIITDSFLLQQTFVENMVGEFDAIILEEKLSIDQFLIHKKYENFNQQELESYAQFLANALSINTNCQPLSQQKLDEIFKNFFQSYSMANEEILKVIQRLEKKIKQMADIFKADILEIQQRNILQQEKIDFFSYFSSTKVLVATQGEILTTYITQNMHFKKAFSINTYHKKITSLCLDQQDKQNQIIYTSGVDQMVKIWVNKIAQSYILERQFKVESDQIFKLLYIPRQQQLLTCSKTMLISWDSNSGIQVQNIGEKITQSELLSVEINNSGACIICQTKNNLQIWNYQWNWKLFQIIECQNVQGFCFINNSQFISFSRDNKIILWALKTDQFKEHNNIIFDYQIEDLSLQFIQDQSILVCMNNDECIFLQLKLKENFQINVLQTIRGKNMKICVSQNGEYFIILNFGQLSIRKTSKIFEDA